MNWALMSHPINWLTVLIMAAFGGLILDIILHAWINRSDMGAK